MGPPGTAEETGNNRFRKNNDQELKNVFANAKTHLRTQRRQFSSTQSQEQSERGSSEDSDIIKANEYIVNS